MYFIANSNTQKKTYNQNKKKRSQYKTKTKQQQINDHANMVAQLNSKTSRRVNESYLLTEMRDNDLFRNHLFKKYRKEQVIEWLINPEFHQDQLVDVSRYMYNISNHYKRLIKYFGGIPLFSYHLVPQVEFNSLDELKKKYNEAIRILKTMRLRHEFNKIAEVCFREDTFYGAVVKDKKYTSFNVKRLPYKWCRISYTIDGCYGISFNFDYFNSHINKLGQYPKVFKDYYEKSKSQRDKWMQIPIEDAFAIKWDESIDYNLPPMVGVLPSLFDLEEYQKLKKVKEQIGNYKILELVSEFENGLPVIDDEVMRNYYDMICAAVPENIGVVLTPAKLNEHTFDKVGQTVADVVEQATDDFFANAGVSKLLFGSNKTGTTAIAASIQVDSTYIYGMYRQMERLLDLYLRREFGNRQLFKVEVLDITVFTAADKIAQLITQAQYGISGAISQLLAINNISLMEVDHLATLENTVFDLHNKFIPLQSSHTQSSNISADVGVPTKDEDELTEEGAATRERDGE